MQIYLSFVNFCRTSPQLGRERRRKKQRRHKRLNGLLQSPDSPLYLICLRDFMARASAPRWRRRPAVGPACFSSLFFFVGCWLLNFFFALLAKSGKKKIRDCEPSLGFFSAGLCALLTCPCPCDAYVSRRGAGPTRSQGGVPLHRSPLSFFSSLSAR